ncbi:CopG family ribbon-helix-helix protein [Desulfurococcus mucosus]|uniref:Putative transcriptional regulator, CopG family n=1 Tax=Desulfurococcus mucosus (strain ATCC 35584 / DSM 2162 / JCM 9187 / O7/1) TaxID=765177 RepID=E8R9A4_DESM0|nr:CopG family transcriptional regulator [Desulfurococcus mucosus]ADV65080.1 putative transcriptional regulator, CopG family [Desulfurococcus mucosus DSM 2162]
MSRHVKRRFGISIPSNIAERLDNLAELLHCDRSTIVSNALNEYIHENLHGEKEHECRGVIVAYTSASPPPNLFSKYTDVVSAYSLYKVRDGFIMVLVVEGSSRLINELRTRISSHASVQRYMPLDTSYSQGEG